jgi:hypothetical protein
VWAYQVPTPEESNSQFAETHLVGMVDGNMSACHQSFVSSLDSIELHAPFDNLIHPIARIDGETGQHTSTSTDVKQDTVLELQVFPEHERLFSVFEILCTWI